MKSFSDFLIERSNLAAERLAALKKEHAKPISKSQLDTLEKFLDKLFSDLNIDIEFSNHFFDRLHDKRNKTPITIAELNDLFQKTHAKFGTKISHEPDKFEAVIKSISSKLNVPFVIRINTGNIQLISKTIMRKDNFKTTSQEMKV